MSAKRFAVLGTFLSLMMSAIALGWQIKKEIPSAPFQEFYKPLRESGILVSDYVSLRAEVEMIREQMPFKQGIGVPDMITVVSYRTVVIHIPVESRALPANFEERKIAFGIAAGSAIGNAIATFNRDEMKDYYVLFVDRAKAITDSEQGKRLAGVIAEYKNNQLTIH